MPFLPTAVLPKNVLTALRRPNTVIPVSSALVDAAKSDPPEVLAALKTSENGLSEEEAERRLEQVRPQRGHARSSGTRGSSCWAMPVPIRW